MLRPISPGKYANMMLWMLNPLFFIILVSGSRSSHRCPLQCHSTSWIREQSTAIYVVTASRSFRKRHTTTAWTMSKPKSPLTTDGSILPACCSDMLRSRLTLSQLTSKSSEAQCPSEFSAGIQPCRDKEAQTYQPKAWRFLPEEHP